MQVEHTYFVRSKGFKTEFEGRLQLVRCVISRGDRVDFRVNTSNASKIESSEKLLQSVSDNTELRIHDTYFLRGTLAISMSSIYAKLAMLDHNIDEFLGNGRILDTSMSTRRTDQACAL